MRSKAERDYSSLVAGLALLGLGLALLADQTELLDLRFATMAPIVCATVGAILLASGLNRR